MAAPLQENIHTSQVQGQSLSLWMYSSLPRSFILIVTSIYTQYFWIYSMWVVDFEFDQNFTLYQ